jgi:magnesium chelatase family protein
VLESLREPLETGAITLARAAARIELPAAFQLVAAMNPCPCGYHGDEERECRCRPRRIERYRGRISGPLLDRIDLVIEVPRVATAELLAGSAAFLATSATSSGGAPVSRAAHAAMSAATLREQVHAARMRQRHRSDGLNARLGVAELAVHCALDAAGTRLLAAGVERLGLSGRGLHRVLRVARTIADLEQYERIAAAHVAEALQLRRVPHGA